MNKSIKKILIKFGLIIISIIFIMMFVLSIYAANPYESLEEMWDEIETLDKSNIVVREDFDEISYSVDNPKKNIIFIPGGLVTPDSYSYLAISLAIEQYNVTIVKPAFNLAILSPNRANKFINDNLDNIIIGHSLGGVTASIVASKNAEISKAILLGSYPIRNLNDIDTLMITAEFDLGMNEDEFEESLKYVNDENEIIDIDGGNHAQFGWYGPQKGDGEAEISTLEQQNLVINHILDFIK